MSKSRHILVLSITTLFILLLGVSGWCGGPVAPGRTGADQSAPQSAPRLAMGDGATQSGGFSLSGTAGSSSANGVDSVSPYVNLGSLGIQNAFTYGVRAAYVPRRFPSLRVIGDYLEMHFKGSTGFYNSSAWHPILNNGQGAEGKLDVGIWSLTGDFLPSLAGRGIVFGPRLQVMLHNDNFQITNTTTNTSGSGNASSCMYGAGFAGKFDFNEISGMHMGHMVPYLDVSASLGTSSKMRYYTWEVAVSIFRTSPAGGDPYETSWWKSHSWGLGVELGYMEYGFRSINREEELYTFAGGFVPPPIRPNELRYELRVPFIRGTVTF